MNEKNVDLTFTKDEWDRFSGEQKLAIGLLRRTVADLKKPTAALIRDVEGWLTFDGTLGPSFMDQLLELQGGVVAAHIKRKLEEAKEMIKPKEPRSYLDNTSRPRRFGPRFVAPRNV